MFVSVFREQLYIQQIPVYVIPVVDFFKILSYLLSSTSAREAIPFFYSLVNPKKQILPGILGTIYFESGFFPQHSFRYSGSRCPPSPLPQDANLFFSSS
jgi:hypothetical protein